jgi:SAM-dependent methyltransferase
MNLFDLVKRPDRAVAITGDRPRAETVQMADGKTVRSVVLPVGCTVTLHDAHEFTTWWNLSQDLGWAVPAASGAAPKPRLELQVKSPTAQRLKVGVRASSGEQGVCNLAFDWPTECVTAARFDLHIRNPEDRPLSIFCGPQVNMRQRLLPFARGRGLEVGPGLRPVILPSKEVDISYLEEQDPADWLNLYNKTGDKPAMPEPAVLARYRKGSAVRLEGVAPGSLDFIFSSHVFEHLSNPVQVLANWRQALRPGGMILAVVPDPRYTFDIRQAPTTLHEALLQESAGGHEVSHAQLERWCRFTEPRHTPADLLKRGYSIHVNFFTPESFASTAHALKERGWFDQASVFSAPNHKDFAFALRVAGPP